MKVEDIQNSIIRGSWTNAELNTMAEAIRWARSQLGKSNKRHLSIGSRVQWDSSRSGIKMSGIVEKVAIKFVTVRTPQSVWRVPASMLEVV